MRGQSAVLVPLIGIMARLGSGCGRDVLCLQVRHNSEYGSWLQGNFSLVIAGKYELLYLSVPLMFLAYFYADYFTIAGMGEGTALSLGLNHAAIVNAGLFDSCACKFSERCGRGQHTFRGAYSSERAGNFLRETA